MVIHGDVLQSCADVILHQVNCQGVMGSGVAKQVKDRYPQVFDAYKALCLANVHNKAALLGVAQFVPIRSGGDRYIVNLFAQENFGRDGKCYTDYDALRNCLAYVNKHSAGKEVAIPYLMSCARGGGDWDIVSKMIEETLVDCDVTYYKYI